MTTLEFERVLDHLAITPTVPVSAVHGALTLYMNLGVAMKPQLFVEYKDGSEGSSHSKGGIMIPQGDKWELFLKFVEKYTDVEVEAWVEAVRARLLATTL
jgi:hypothetical protein